MSQIVLTTALILHHTLSNFRCTTLKSGISLDYDNAPTSVSCNDAYPTLVSCGFSPHVTTGVIAEKIDGGYMRSIIATDSHACIAENGSGGSGVYAHARY